MDQPPDLENVYSAVYTLYHSLDKSEKEKASSWLTDIQRSIFAWKLADEMLHQKRSLESCYFAAQTMRSKVQLSFHELPPETHISLRDSLIIHITQIDASTNVEITTQLCLALGDLAIQMTGWTKAVSELIEQLGVLHPWQCLEILTIIPEEINSKSIRLGAIRRQEVLNNLSSCSSSVLFYLNNCLAKVQQYANTQIHIRILRCFTSWICIQAFDLSNIINDAIIDNAFSILMGNMAECPRHLISLLHDAATECICTLLQALEDNNNEIYMETKIYNGVTHLEQIFYTAVSFEETEKILNYTRIFTELGESFLEKMIIGSGPNQPHYAVKILDLVLACVGHHDYEVAEITFNLWYRLSEELYQKNNDGLFVFFKPYIERLIEALCRHCQIEPDHEGLLEEGDDFADFRLKVSELIKDVVFIVGSSNCFRQMFINLGACQAAWEAIEASLFVMQSVAKNVLPAENEIVPKVVTAILGLKNNTHITVRHTCILLLGELCEWFESHSVMLGSVLNFLLSCLQQPELASASAGAIQNICTACKDHMAVHFYGLFELVMNIDNFSLTNEAAIGLLKACSVILTKMPHENLHLSMKELTMLQIRHLSIILENNVKPEKGSKQDPVIWLDRVAAIYRHTTPQVSRTEIHPCLSIAEGCWPILSKTFQRFSADVRIMERLCRCLRFMIRCLSKHITNTFLETLVKSLIENYQNNQHSCFLYLGSVLVDEYAAIQEYHNMMLDMLVAFIYPTFNLVKEGLSIHPDTVDDFFRLYTRYIQRQSEVFLRVPPINGIIDMALASLEITNRDAITSVLKFFHELILSARQHESSPDFHMRQRIVKEIIDIHGATLVAKLINNCLFTYQNCMFSDVADILIELVQVDKFNGTQHSRDWIQDALKNILAQHNYIVPSDFPQIVNFPNNIMQANSQKSVLSSLKELAKLFR